MHSLFLLFMYQITQGNSSHKEELKPTRNWNFHLRPGYVKIPVIE